MCVVHLSKELMSVPSEVNVNGRNQNLVIANCTDGHQVEKSDEPQ